MLLALQVVHTLIMLANEALAGYLVWCAVTGRGGRERWYAFFWLLGVLGLIVVCGFECPMQRLARHIAGVDQPVRDMLTPGWFNALVVPVTIPIVSASIGVILARAQPVYREAADGARGGWREWAVLRRAVLAAVAYFALVIAAGFVLGVMRLLLVRPVTGEFVAVLIELPLMLIVSWYLCGWLVERFALPSAWQVRLIMGSTAFLLLMLAEIGLAMGLFGRSVGEHFAQLRTPGGLAGLIGQLAFALLPLVRRGRGRPRRTGDATVLR